MKIMERVRQWLVPDLEEDEAERKRVEEERRRLIERMDRLAKSFDDYDDVMKQ